MKHVDNYILYTMCNCNPENSYRLTQQWVFLFLRENYNSYSERRVIYMKTAWNEYKELILRPSTKWLAKHWKGYLVFLAIIYVVSFVIGFIWASQTLKCKIKEFFRKLRRR